ncbi:hypothetical protein [Catalinimonas niigatensis]|uniref:hypothetical protein n=1 Tax=Catalinimonas niigatensis TaxID=1397264 RepID=UPI002666E008|nr:hypothetical protein [Catalinimonas niigatensis]WPP48361.1 hypothetical protein PZB72_16940 [Catalinimonas niigatensis]
MMQNILDSHYDILGLPEFIPLGNDTVEEPDEKNVKMKLVYDFLMKRSLTANSGTYGQSMG